MSEQAPETTPAAAPPAAGEPGPITRLAEKFHLGGELHAAEHVVATVATDVQTLAGHHSAIFAVVAEMLHLVEVLDPADAPAIAAAEALLPKLFAMAASAAAAGSVSLKAS